MTIVYFLILLASATGAAIYVDRMRAEAVRLRLLVELSERLQLSTSIDQAIDVLPSFAQRLFPRLEGAVYVSRAVPDVVELATVWGDGREEEALEKNACSALRTCTPSVSTDPDASACEHVAMIPRGDTICAPMLTAGDTFGLLILRAPTGSALPPAIEQIAKVFAHQIALALSNLRLQDTLRAAAIRDSLTGLYNRRCMEQSLTLELLSAGDPNVHVGVILVDVDHFKRFNDTWGHGGGDALLQQLARLMQSVFGPDDIVCRYGGEEFVIFLSNVTFEDVRASAEHLRRRVAELRPHCNGQLLDATSISVGIAISPNHGTTLEGLITAADHALYAAKSAGRNRVCTPPPQALGRDAA